MHADKISDFDFWKKNLIACVFPQLDARFSRAGHKH